MRKTLLATLSGTAVMATLALFSTPAEAIDTRCRIPFSFEVRGKTLPPGLYTFTPGPGELWVRGRGQGAVVMTLGLQSIADGGARAVFERKGDSYILREVWDGGRFARELLQPRVRAERSRTVQEGGAAERVVIPAF